MKSKVRKVKDVRRQVDLSSQTITSADLFSIQPILSRQVIPHDNFQLNLLQFNRVDALPVPSFVKVKNRVDTFYVKYCQVWKPFDAFNTQKPYAAPSVLGGSSSSPYSNTIPTELPYVSILDLYNLFSVPYFGLSTKVNNPTYRPVAGLDPVVINNYSLAYDAVVNCHAYDFITLNSSSETFFGFKLTPKGQKVWSLFSVLGLKLPHVIQSEYAADYGRVHMSILPLMAFLSVKVNYYTPLKFRDYSFVNALSYLVDPVPSHRTDVSSSQLEDIVKPFYDNIIDILCQVYYGSDYFTDSAISVFGPTPTYSFHDPVSETYTRGVASGATPGNTSFSEPMIRADVNNGGYNSDHNYNVTEYLLYALKALTSEQQIAALTKNDLVAAATSLFGYKPDVADMVPLYLNHTNDLLVVSPETSMADTYNSSTNQGTPLGYKSGTMNGSLIVGQKDKKGKYHPLSFDFETNGQLLVVNSVSPDVMYTDGIPREVLNTTRKLFYDSNLARLGYQAVGMCELLLDIEQSTTKLDSSFGLKPKFSEFSYKVDLLGGMFCVPTLSEGLDSFHFSRLVSRFNASNDMWFALARSSSFTNNIEDTDGHQFDRIFQIADGFVDHIQQWNIFDIKARRDVVGKNEFTIGDDYDGKDIENPSLGSVINA